MKQLSSDDLEQAAGGMEMIMGESMSASDGNPPTSADLRGRTPGRGKTKTAGPDPALPGAGLLDQIAGGFDQLKEGATKAVLGNDHTEI